MAFSAAQNRKLRRDVREVNGRELSYIEGWHAIDEANRIFGFDGWNRERRNAVRDLAKWMSVN